jgi:type VI secretion system secreted protein VgrG
VRDPARLNSQAVHDAAPASHLSSPVITENPMANIEFSQADRSVSVHCKLDDDVLLFQQMEGSEHLGRLFEYRISLLSLSGDVKIADVLGKDMHVRIDLHTESKRHFHGVVTRFSRQPPKSGFFAYEAVIRPALWLLTRSANCRIFQDKTTIEILKEVCARDVYGGQIKLREQLNGTPAKRPYCVQYRETDFNFVSRLLEEEGMYYYFEHAKDAHAMVVVDSTGAHSEVPGYEKIRFHPGEGRGSDTEDVKSWSPAGQIEPGLFTLNDYNYEKSAASRNGGLMVKTNMPDAFDLPKYEQYDYPGRFDTSKGGDLRTRAWSESIHGQSEQYHGVATARGLITGGLFELEDHPDNEENRKVLVTGSDLLLIGQDYVSGSGANNAMAFTCRFTAVGTEHSYRPLPVHEKPFVRGPQTAMVVGKAGEEIWTDEYGRIKVQFHWDRLGKDDENSSCWVRVAQAWSGKGWGTMFLPRIGMEVVVEFLEGDPDRPLVTGCVYNSDAMPPYALPENQTRATIKSNTTRGGGGFNEIRFEDKSGNEEIFVQAERDFNRVVKNNDTLKVGFEKKDKGDQTVDIKNDQKLDVGHDQTTHVSNNQTVKIDGKQDVTIGNTCVIEAMTSIEFKVGASSIKIEPAKITVKSVEVEVDANAMMKLKAGGIMTIEGALVKIN